MIEALIKIIGVVSVMLLMVAYMILIERKVAAWVQDRVGPNRAGPFGLLQPFCDGLKLLFKEDYTPLCVDKVLFILAPCITMMMAVCAIAVIPFGGTLTIGEQTYNMQIASVDVGVLYILALSSIGVYGIVFGAWASNSKFSLLGGVRAASLLLSYEVPLTLSLLSVILMAGSLQPEIIVDQQIAGGWNILYQPITFIIFLICIFAEANRLPFDLAECEQELVGGYHTEYSSMKFGLFFLGEYAHIIVASSLAVSLFFGGWHLPWITMEETTTVWAVALRVVVFLIKVWLFILFYMWVRWSLPRFRFDRVMNLAWKSLVPLSLALLIGNILVLAWFTPQTPAFRIGQLVVNLIVFAGLILVLTRTSSQPDVANQPLKFTQTNV